MFDFLGNLEISFDWSWVDMLSNESIFTTMWFFFIKGGWVLFAYVFLYGGWKLFVYSRVQKYAAKQTFVFLAVDIPKNNLQTPRAVENIFSILAGAHSPLEWGEKRFEGKYQLGFSFEIVSIDGYVQFIIMTPTGFRNLVEASIYSQYPDAEIVEVEDYTKNINVVFPSDEFNLWGADLVPVNKEYYPIRSYLEFQEEFDPEVKFKDPMAGFLEIMNKIGPGEQIWFQIIVIPADNDWMIAGKKAIGKIMGIPEKATKTVIDKVLDVPLKGLQVVSEQFLGSPIGEEKKADKFDINRLTPIQKNEVEAIARKIDRVCFNCKARYVYFGRKEVFKKGLAVSGIMGAIKQFTSTGLNALKPGKNKTQARLLFADYKLARLQNQILAAYKDRNADTTIGTYILSTEELATLWHFPYMSVKAPLVRKIEAKRGSAPIGLPLDALKPKAEDIPEEIPVETATPAVDYDNDYFEERFALDKTGVKDKERKEDIVEDLEDGRVGRFKIEYEEDAVVSPQSFSKQIDGLQVASVRTVEMPANEEVIVQERQTITEEKPTEKRSVYTLSSMKTNPAGKWVGNVEQTRVSDDAQTPRIEPAVVSDVKDEQPPQKAGGAPSNLPLA